MPRTLPATGPAGAPSGDLTLLKTIYVTTCFLLTLCFGLSLSKILNTTKREKVILFFYRFSTGVCFGTAMLDMLRDADVEFIVRGFGYPFAYVVCCFGFVVYLLVEWLLVFAVRFQFRDRLDALTFALGEGSQPTTCGETTSPGTSKSCPEDRDIIANLRNNIIYQVTAEGDYNFLTLVFCHFLLSSCTDIWDVNTPNMASTALPKALAYSVIYTVPLIVTLIRTAKTHHFLQYILFIWFSMSIPFAFVLDLILAKNLSGDSGPDGVATGVWPRYSGFYKSFLAGVLIYISVHHVPGGWNHSGSRLVGLLAMLSGFGAVAVLKYVAN